MAKLKLFSTIFSKLSSLTKKDGQIIISKDSQSLYIDVDGERVEITDWIDIDTEKELLATLSPLTNKFYYTKDTHKIWRYINSQWENLNTSSSVTGVKGSAEESYRQGNVEITPDNIGLGKVDNISKADLLLAIYPVGSIYMSATNTNPSTLFGGTWEAWGSGRVPVGVNANDENFNSVEKTGGASTVTLTTAQMPKHTHTFTGTAAEHTHTFTGTAASHSHTFTGTAAKHTHTFTGSSATTGNQSANHTHSVTAKGSISGGSHTHAAEESDYYLTIDPDTGGVNRIRRTMTAESSGSNYFLAVGSSSGNGVSRRWNTASASHTHTFTGSAATSGNNSVSHTHTVTAKGTNSDTSITPAGTVKSKSITPAGTNENTSITPAGKNSNTGSSSAHSNLQPYITCYMWKRTA